MAAMDLLGRLFSRTGDRDGRFGAVEQAFLNATAPARAPDAPEGGPELLQATIATKVLEGWLANRQQTLLPHTLNFRALPPAEGALLVALMAAAAQADGRVDDSEARQLPQAIARVGGVEAELSVLSRALQEPQPLALLLERVQEAGLATHAYAAALLAINRRGRANRAFLDYLAARLSLSREVAGSLERRYQA